jgi:hypothetical protein
MNRPSTPKLYTLRPHAEHKNAWERVQVQDGDRLPPSTMVFDTLVPDEFITKFMNRFLRLCREELNLDDNSSE